MAQSNELRELPDDELLGALEDKKVEIFNLRFQKASGQLEDTNQLRYAKRDFARLLTILRERELATLVTEEEASDA